MRLPTIAAVLAVGAVACGSFSSADPIIGPDAATSEDGGVEGSDGGDGATTPFARDTFSRTVSNSFGTAELGGAWDSRFSGGGTMSVSGGTGNMLLKPGRGAGAYLNEVAQLDIDEEVSMASETFHDPEVTNGVYIALVARRRGEEEYHAQAVVRTGVITGLSVFSRLADGEHDVAKATASNGFAKGEPIHLRFQAIGASPTRLRMRAWRSSEPEPSTWAIDTSDMTATSLQGAGSVGVQNYLSSQSKVDVSIAVDDFVARPASP